MWIDQVSRKELEQKIKWLPECQKVHLDYDSSANLELPGLPCFNYVFDELCNILQDLPTQEAYAYYYLKSAVENNCILPELVVRAKRNYPSFVREYHLYRLLKENIEGKVYFNRIIDALGVDLVLEYKQKKFGIRTFVDTPYSQKHHRRKYSNQKDDLLKSILKLDGIVDLPIIESTATVLNGYWLYNEKHLELILDRLGGRGNGRHH